MDTVKMKSTLKEKAQNEIIKLKSFWKEDYSPLIADIGANIGYYTSVLLSEFPDSKVHSYEPHPYNLGYLTKQKSDRLTIHQYGLFNKTTKLSIGLPENRLTNNGMFSIHHSANSIEVDLKNANDEEIRPNIVKIDVEVAEPQILECTLFFEKTKIILIEIIKQDSLGINNTIIDRLNSIGFKYESNLSKNNQLWLK